MNRKIFILIMCLLLIKQGKADIQTDKDTYNYNEQIKINITDDFQEATITFIKNNMNIDSMTTMEKQIFYDNKLESGKYELRTVVKQGNNQKIYSKAITILPISHIPFISIFGVIAILLFLGWFKK